MAELRSIVVYLDTPSRSEQVRAILAAAGFDARVADCSDQVRQFGSQQHVDGLVIQQELPGYLSGVEIIERIRRELLNPVLILVGDIPPDQNTLLRELKVDHVLPASAAPEMIRDCVRASFVVAGPASLRIPLAARKIAEANDCFKPLPQIVLKVMTRLGEDGGDAAELANDIAVDPRLTAELLRITNSSSSGLRFKVSHVADAVKYLGFRRSVALIVAIAQKSLQGDGFRKLPDWIDPWFRSRSLLTASVGFAFADQHLKGSAEQAYVIGLLQDLGVLALAHHIGPRYLALIERCRKIGQLQLLVGEHQQFNVDHAEVSAALLQKWGVPVSVIRQVLYHHDDSSSQLTEFEFRLCEVMRFAEAVADMHDAPSPQRQRRLMQQAEAFDGLNSDSCKSSLTRAIGKVAEFEDLLQIPVPPEEELREFIAGLAVELQATEDGQDLTTMLPERIVAAPSPGQRQKTLLVIEDDEELIALIRALLDDAPLRVLAAASAEHAADSISACQGVLCDIHLPGIGGIEFVAAIRSRGFAGSILMMSGDRTRDAVMRSAQNGATGYLLKPFSQAELLAALQRHQLLP